LLLSSSGYEQLNVSIYRIRVILCVNSSSQKSLQKRAFGTGVLQGLTR
jgi:hypothetical protein